MGPKVSILIASFNHEAYLPDCLASVVGQTFLEWEVILVDDLSQDSSWEMAQNWSLKDPRIKVFRNETNLGTYGTQQRALEQANGELVVVLNSDDYWDADKLILQVDAMQQNPEASWCFCRAMSVGSLLPAEMPTSTWPTAGVFNAFPLLLPQNDVAASSVMFRKKGLRFNPDCRYSGDWLALIEASLRGSAVAVPKVLSYWRQHNSNSYVRSASQLEEEIWLRREILKLAHAVKNGSPALAECAMHLSALQVLAGQLRKGRHYSWMALLLDPSLRTFKRWLATLLPLNAAMRRLWPGQTPIEIPGERPRRSVDWNALPAEK